MKILNTSMLIITLIISVTGCKKAETGPQGSAGQQGLTGATGVQGNANVNTNIFNVSPANWVQSSHANTATFIDSNITQAIVDSGVVMVFKLTPSHSTWTPLPFSITDFTTNYIYNWTFFYSPNQIKFRVEESLTIPPNPGNNTFKVVTISTSARNQNPAADWNNYEKIKSLFNLKD